MARTHILLGYGSAQRDALPHVIHVGRDADAAIKARNQALLPGSGFAVVEHLDGPRGYRKTNTAPGEPFDLPVGAEVDQADKEQLAHSLKEAEHKLDAAAHAQAELLAANNALKAAQEESAARLAALTAERDANAVRIAELEAQASDLQSRLAEQMQAKAKAAQQKK